MKKKFSLASKLNHTVLAALLLICFTTVNVMAATGLSPDFIPSPKTSVKENVVSASATIPILSYGSKGYNVTLLQAKLKKIGYFNASATGTFLTSTKNAVIKFQTNSKLSPTGTVGIFTWNALNKRTKAATNSRSSAIISTKFTVFNRTLQIGSKGSDVSLLQDKLIQLGLLTGKKDGIYGKLTSASIKNFQLYKKTSANGVADELTVSNLMNTASISASFLDKLKKDAAKASTTPPAIGLPSQKPSPTTTTPKASQAPSTPSVPTTLPLATPKPLPTLTSTSTSTSTATPIPTPTPASTSTSTTIPIPTPSSTSTTVPSATPIPTPSPVNDASGIPAANTSGSGVVLPIQTPDTDLPPPDEAIPEDDDGSLAGKTIIVDAGHGFSDPGTSRASVYEKTITLSVALKLKKKLEAAGANVIMTRTTDGAKGLYYLFYRSAVANKMIVEKELAKTNFELSQLSEATKATGLLVSAKFAELQTLSANTTNIDAQKNLSAKFLMQQEYNALLQSVAGQKTLVDQKNAYISELENMVASLDLYINDPTIKDRIGTYAMDGKKASSELATIFDITEKNYSKDTVFLSIHVNATEANETTASGTKVYISDRSSSYYTAYYPRYNHTQREKLGALLLDSLNQTSSFSQKTTKPTKSNLSVLKENNLTSALVELAFMNNASDRRKLLTQATQDALALGMFNGLEAYFQSIH